jgi:hypothetical protein
LPGVCHFVVPLIERAQGRPGADCARRSRAPEHTGIPCAEAHGQGLQVQPGHPGLPGAMAYGLYELSPVSGLYCHRCRPHTGGADRRQGRGARTTRLRRTLRRFRREPKPLTPQASIATRTTFRDDREAPLMAARAEAEHSSDLRNSQEGILKIGRALSRHSGASPTGRANARPMTGSARARNP